MTGTVMAIPGPGVSHARFEEPIPEAPGYVDVPVVDWDCDGVITYGLVLSEDGTLIAAEEDDDFIGYVHY